MFRCSTAAHTLRFDQVTEDGVAFRIYKLGSLEATRRCEFRKGSLIRRQVRTIQEVEKPEMVHALSLADLLGEFAE